MREKNKKDPAQKDVAKKKPKREKRQRTPKELTALMLGCVGLVLSVLGVAALLFLSGIVGAILGGCAVLIGFSSFMVGKGGALPAVVAIVAGFLTVLSFLVMIQLK